MKTPQSHKPVTSVRQRLRNATKSRHEAVHLHPLFSRLLATDITAPELQAINLAHLRVFTQVESARRSLSVWPELSLRNRINALRSDLLHVPEVTPTVSTRDPAYVLGSLYVAFGSAFGAQVIVKSLKCALPDSPVTYYEMKDPDIWQTLCARLERLDSSYIDHAINGANAVFDALLLTPARINPNAIYVKPAQKQPQNIGYRG